MSAPNQAAPRGRGFLVILGFLSAGVTALVIGSLLTTHWYELNTDGVSQTMGIFRSCADGVGCHNTNYDTLAVNTPQCTRKSKDIRARYIVVAVFSITGGACGLIAFLCTIASIQRGASLFPLKIATMFSVLGLSALIVTIVVWVYTYENWLFCDNTPCKFLKSTGSSTSCTGQYGYSFMLVCIGAGLHTIVLMLEASFLLMCRESESDRITSATEPTAQAPQTEMESTRAIEPVPSQIRTVTPPPAQATPPRAAPATAGGATNPIRATPPHMPNLGSPKDGKVPAPPPGDWVFDNESGLYWSDSHYLFLHPQTNQYYDPKSDMWYDPETDKWYEAK